jgi:hypothetical protein
MPTKRPKRQTARRNALLRCQPDVRCRLFDDAACGASGGSHGSIRRDGHAVRRHGHAPCRSES